MEWSTICKHCQTLGHEFYGLADKVSSQCQWDKKTCQDIVVEGESVPLLTWILVLMISSRSSSHCPLLGVPYSGPN